MINSVTLVGRLTRDPDFRQSQNGTAVTRFTLAINRQYKKDGKQEADFINCIVFRKQAENVNRFCYKGQLVGVTGRIQTGSYEKDGQRIHTTDVIADSVQFLEFKGNNTEDTQNTNTRQGNNPYVETPISDDDLPF